MKANAIQAATDSTPCSVKSDAQEALAKRLANANPDCLRTDGIESVWKAMDASFLGIVPNPASNPLATVAP